MEKTVTLQKQEVKITATEFLQENLLICKFPNGNRCLTIKRSKKTDKDVLALAALFGINEFEVPKS